MSDEKEDKEELDEDGFPKRSTDPRFRNLIFQDFAQIWFFSGHRVKISRVPVCVPVRFSRVPGHGTRLMLFVLCTSVLEAVNA